MSRASIHRAVAAVFVSVAIVGAAGARDVTRPPFELAGSWYLLVHYRDTTPGGPSVWQWEDRVWSFEWQGEVLVWRDQPKVPFRARRGRVEELPGGREGRSVGRWEPDSQQLEEIAAGDLLDESSIRRKSLRGSPARGYHSGGEARQRSASVIGYHEQWRIEWSAEGLPIFSWVDAMGSGRTGSMSGRTRFLTEERLDAGDELRGVYARDGVREGVFRLLRMGGHEAEAR